MQHPNNNTCVEQWYCNVVYPLNNGLCNIDGAINHVDGSIDMTVIVYKVDGATVKFPGNIIDLIDGTQKTSKVNETDSQTNIDIEVVNSID